MNEVREWKRVVMKEDDLYMWIEASQIRVGDNPVGKNTVRHIQKRIDSRGYNVFVFNAGYPNMWTAPSSHLVRVWKRLPKRIK